MKAQEVLANFQPQREQRKQSLIKKKDTVVSEKVTLAANKLK